MVARGVKLKDGMRGGPVRLMMAVLEAGEVSNARSIHKGKGSGNGRKRV